VITGFEVVQVSIKPEAEASYENCFVHTKYAVKPSKLFG
jgi:hypothetical protein